MEENIYVLGPQFSTFTRSVCLFCEEKGIAYKQGMQVDGNVIQMGSEALYHYHPFGKVPVIFHHGQVIFETLTICHYLDNVFTDNKLLPELPEKRAEIESWANCLATYVDHILVRRYLLEFAFPKGEEGKVRDAVIHSVEPDVIKILALLEQQLTNKPFFKSEQFTLTDVILLPILDYLAKLPHAKRLFQNTPCLMNYLVRMQARNSVKKVLT